jgi:hypothetical protein
MEPATFVVTMAPLNEPNTEDLHVRVSLELKADLRKLARAEHRTFCGYLRHVLTKAVQDATTAKQLTNV